METKGPFPHRVKTANKKQSFPSLTAGENWGKYLAGLATEIFFGLGLCLIALIIATILLAMMR